MLPESIIDSIFNTAVKFVVEKMTARVGNDFQEAVHWCFDSLVHWLAGVLVGVGCKEVWDFPDVTSSTHDGVSNHVVEVVARHWPFTDNVTAINAESSCRHTNGIHLFGAVSGSAGPLDSSALPDSSFFFSPSCSISTSEPELSPSSAVLTASRAFLISALLGSSHSS